MSKRILILGGARFHGLQLAESLAKKGEEVYVLNRGNFKQDYDFGIKHLIEDRNKPEIQKILSNKKFDCIIDNNAYKPEQIKSILNIIKDNGHYIFTSTSAVYLKLFSYHRLKEEEAIGIQEGFYNPNLKDYAVNKLNCEFEIKNSGKKDYTILRFPNIYGEGDFAGKISFFYRRFKENKKIILEKEIEEFSLIYVKDVVKIFEKVLGNANCFDRIINIADSKTYTPKEFIDSIFGKNYSENILTMPVEEIWESGYFPYFLGGPQIDNSLCHKLIGNFDYTPLDEWGKKTLEWELRNVKQKLQNLEYQNIIKKEKGLIKKI